MRELTTNEIDQVSGGELNLGHIATGVGVLAFGATILATAGLASVPLCFGWRSHSWRRGDNWHCYDCRCCGRWFYRVRYSRSR